jgi:hypothetical protein
LTSPTRSPALTGTRDFPFQSFAFGLRLASNVAVPGLNLVFIDQPAQVSFTLGHLPSTARAEEELFLRSEEDRDGEANLRVWRSSLDRHYRLRYQDGTEFVVSREGDAVWGIWPEDTTLEDTATYLLGPIMGLVLRLRGTVCLHAGAVEIDGSLAVFAGIAGAGKSSLSATFALAGYPVSGDDVLPIIKCGQEFLACAAYSRIRLWPDSARALVGSEENLPRLTPTWDKRFLSLDGNGRILIKGYQPIRAIYVLARSEEETRLDRLGARDSLLTLVSNTYANYLLDSEMRTEELMFLSGLVGRVPVFLLSLRRDLGLLQRNAEQIARHFRERPE